MSRLLRSLGLLLLGLSLWAVPPVHLGQESRHALAGHLELLAGAPAETLEQALQAAAEGRFVAQPGNIAKGYAKACYGAARETGLPEATFPPTCPWSFEQIGDDAFWPGGGGV